MQKILVIEDDESLRVTIIEALKRCGYELLEAEHGALGLEIAKAELPDLILCDMEMPVLSGKEVLKALRSDATTAGIPFIIMTCRPDRTSMRLGMFLGADDYLPKPFSVADLVAAIKGRLQRQLQMRELMEGKVAQLRANLGLSLPHELLTPLTGILGMAGLMKEDYGSLHPNEVYSMALIIEQAGNRLLRTIKNYLLHVDLEFADQDAAQAQLMTQGRLASIHAVVESVAQNIAQKYSRPGDLSLALADSPVAMGEEYFCKIVEELVENAFMFSKAGAKVLVSTAATPEMLILSIRDHGRGMTLEQIAQTGAYQQFDRQRYEQQGLGLGLTIAKRLAQLHGGALSIESEVAVGTIVEVRLPR